MRKHESKRRVITAAVILTVVLIGCTCTAARAAEPTAYTAKDLNEQLVMAVAWMQTSAEYRELCYQAFNLAAMSVDRALAIAKPGDRPLAVISDLDETLLDNGAYDAGFIGRNAVSDKAGWLQWEKDGKPLPVPGSLEFLDHAAGKGVEVFYVTNRTAEGAGFTVATLKALSFPFADGKHVLPFDAKGDKQPRFDQVARDFTVVVYLGDNANDLPLRTYGKGLPDRNAIIDRNHEKFGLQLIILPNPVYGDWEKALAASYGGLSPEAKSAARKALLRRWVPPAQ